MKSNLTLGAALFCAGLVLALLATVTVFAFVLVV
ncbi:hypothetical protein [Erwinia phage Virsaitis27]|nr:hypothetical protein [Erwinia phage Virsaitis27]